MFCVLLQSQILKECYFSVLHVILIEIAAMEENY
jgi:hypothetical protein